MKLVSQTFKTKATLAIKKAKSLCKNTSRKKSTRRIKRGLGIDVHNPTKTLLDEELIGNAIWECLKNGDSEGVVEVIQIYLEAVNKTKLAQEADIPKTTLYHAFRSKNPTIKTLAKLVHACI